MSFLINVKQYDFLQGLVKKSWIGNFNFQTVLLPLTFKIHSTWIYNNTVNSYVTYR